ncbi:MAG: hypothetical protein IJJ94_07005 [Bacteroidaceae bacterium]|nr:hypothetical protein [Bacteroidaceae bacterium]
MNKLRNYILPVVAIVLLALIAGPYMLLLLLVIPLGYYTIKLREKREPKRKMYSTIEEVEEEFGKPDDVVVLDASRANDLPALVLFYPSQDLMIAAGEPIKLSDLVSVSPKNMATPYTIDEYAVILSTRNPDRPTIPLRVGYDNGLALEIAQQIDAHIVEHK